MQIFDSSNVEFGARMSAVQVPVYMHGRIPTGMGWVDETFGANAYGDQGLVPSTAVVLTGDPGAGKSTLAFSIAAGMAEAHFNIADDAVQADSSYMERGDLARIVQDLATPREENRSLVLYNSTEESATQIVMRAQRLGLRGAPLRLADESEIIDLVSKFDGLIASERRNGWAGCPVMVLDSVQSMVFDGKGSDVSQSRGFALLTGWAKANKGILIAINQVTGTGKMAGSNKIKHAVDVAVHLENLSDKEAEEMGISEMQPRWLKTRKNRFGCTGLNWLASLRETGFVPVTREVIGGI
jgi:DNA repair protein RadA/Sms